MSPHGDIIKVARQKSVTTEISYESSSLSSGHTNAETSGTLHRDGYTSPFPAQ
jgi:hypothetical protein